MHDVKFGVHQGITLVTYQGRPGQEWRNVRSENILVVLFARLATSLIYPDVCVNCILTMRLLGRVSNAKIDFEESDLSLHY